MRNPERFADAFNFMLFGGRQVIKPDALKELDTDELIIPYGKNARLTAKDSVERHRDILKELAVCKEDDKVRYLILGIENQDQTHYAMPVRNMLYDSIQYAEQVKEAADSSDGDAASSAEFLSGFHKDNRLKPVITLTMHFNVKEWDGAVSLHEMLDDQDPEILAFIPDYNINLIQPSDLSEEDLTKFHSDIEDVMRFLKLSKDRKQMRHMLEEDENLRETYKHMKTDAALVLNSCLNLNIQIDEEKEDTNMSNVFDEIKEEWREEGREEGKLYGLYDLVRKGHLSQSIAAEEAHQSEEEFKAGMEAYFAQLESA